MAQGAQQGVRAIVLRLAAHVYGYKVCPCCCSPALHHGPAPGNARVRLIGQVQGAALANIQAGVAKKRGVAAYTAQGGESAYPPCLVS